MLTLCSKNDEANVLDMLRRHDEMRLREEDLVAWQVNWGPKVENIQTLARTCNIGLDSMVFLDDNPVERDMMSTLLPEVTVPALGEHPVTYLQTLLEGGWFNVLELSAEDTARTHMYRAQREREALLAQADSVEEYLRNLETRIRVRPLDEVNVSRLAQLSLRTNQFNLTGLRFREEELVRLMRDGSHLVLGFEVMDRCGNNGIVSSAVVEMTQEHGRSLWIIRNYVLSCRVFARGIETKVLRYILEQARQHGVSEVIGEYRPSAKNTRYASFYAEHGFVPLESGGDVQRFRHDLQTLPDATPWLELHPAQEQAA
jgi:FkbH-like protein